MASPEIQYPFISISQPLDDAVYHEAIEALSKAMTCARSDLRSKEKELADGTFYCVNHALRLVGGAVKVLSEAHPWLQSIYNILEGAVSLVLKNRKNSKRYSVLLLKQSEMICTLFEVRTISDIAFKGPKNKEEWDDTPLGREAKGMEYDIKYCAAVMQGYGREKGWAARTLKADEWKAEIEICFQMYEDRMRSLTVALNIRTAQRVDQLCLQLSVVLTAFEARTHEEQLILAEIESLGGASSCLKSDKKLTTLAEIARERGYVPEASGDRKTGSNARRILNESDLREIRSDVKAIIKENRKVFEMQLDAQVQLLKRNLAKVTRSIKLAMRSGPHDRVVDPDIRTLWRDMSWRGSVKTRHLASNLFDYYVDLVHAKSESSEQISATLTVPGSRPVSPSSDGGDDVGPGTQKEGGATSNDQARQDTWCLNYMINSSVTDLAEVIDKDSNGWIRIAEINDFTSSKPKDLSMMQWIAYNACGRALEPVLYRWRIESILEKMLTLPYRVENMAFFATYFDSLWSIPTLLRSIVEPSSYMGYESRFVAMVQTLMLDKEEQLRKRIQNISYNISDADDLPEICGYHDGFDEEVGDMNPIEHYLLPLLYVILQHHYTLLTRGCKDILDDQVLQQASSTIESVMDAVSERMRQLSDQFIKQRADPAHSIAGFARGMYASLYRRTKSENFVIYPLDIRSLTDPSIYGPRADHDIINILLRYEDTKSTWKDDELKNVIWDTGEASAPSHQSDALGSLSVYRELLERKIRAEPSYDPYGYVPELSSEELQNLSHLASQLYDGDLQREEERRRICIKLRQEAKHTQCFCDGCRQSPVVGQRFMCADCKEFDLCQTCQSESYTCNKFESQGHPRTHRMLVIPNPIPQTAAYRFAAHVIGDGSEAIRRWVWRLQRDSDQDIASDTPTQRYTQSDEMPKGSEEGIDGEGRYEAGEGEGEEEEENDSDTGAPCPLSVTEPSEPPSDHVELQSKLCPDCEQRSDGTGERSSYTCLMCPDFHPCHNCVMTPHDYGSHRATHVLLKDGYTSSDTEDADCGETINASAEVSEAPERGDRFSELEQLVKTLQNDLQTGLVSIQSRMENLESRTVEALERMERSILAVAEARRTD